MKSIELVRNYLDLHVDRPLNMAELADMACLSQVQLYRQFKREMGLTPCQYGEALKIQESISLLPSLSVLDVATMLGYANYETFTRAFKKHVGLSPAAFKQIYDSFMDLAPHDQTLLIKRDATFSQLLSFFERECLPDYDPEIGVEIYRLVPPVKGRRWTFTPDPVSAEAILHVIAP
ncbi:AraC family transcriptional regulator [Pontibacter sp. G13]|uniref:helix-turn-helix domain-containing protein n=1 Tax=Pontibacter sp. G13 TaxID=3074898 RepID=UPI0028895C24|nr:AraC family transcriptional regulator [Pontibacter sp. G13]WNJ19027.1 AraC family transcriptional regulator [Pontibacter sp. G13]